MRFRFQYGIKINPVILPSTQFSPCLDSTVHEQAVLPRITTLSRQLSLSPKARQLRASSSSSNSSCHPSKPTVNPGFFTVSQTLKPSGVTGSTVMVSDSTFQRTPRYFWHRATIFSIAVNPLPPCRARCPSWEVQRVPSHRITSSIGPSARRIIVRRHGCSPINSATGGLSR